MKPKAKIFISSETIQGVFGDGKWRLLRAVQEQGSIQKAAQSLERSYRKAWGDIKRAEEGLGQALVTKSRGGSQGGQTALTDFGNRLLDAWEEHRKTVHKAVDDSYEKLLKPIVEPQ